MNEWIHVLILLFPLAITWNPLFSLPLPLSLSNTESKIDNLSRCNLIDPVTTTQIFLPQQKAEEWESIRIRWDGTSDRWPCLVHGGNGVIENIWD